MTRTIHTRRRRRVVLSSWSRLSGADVASTLRSGRRMRLVRDVLEWRDVEGEIVVLDLRSATYLAVSGAGAVLWPALLEGAAFGQLAAVVVERFDVAPARAAADVETFLGQLVAQDVLELAEPDAALD